MTLSSWILGLFIATATLAVAEGAEIRLSGRVTDKTSAPISGAKVVLVPAGESQTFETESDPTGAFILLLPAPGDYSISVDRQGFYVYNTSSLRIEAPPFELIVSLDGVHELQTSINVTAPKGSFDMERTATQNTLSSRDRKSVV